MNEKLKQKVKAILNLPEDNDEFGAILDTLRARGVGVCLKNDPAVKQKNAALRLPGMDPDQWVSRAPAGESLFELLCLLIVDYGDAIQSLDGLQWRTIQHIKFGPKWVQVWDDFQGAAGAWCCKSYLLRDLAAKHSLIQERIDTLGWRDVQVAVNPDDGHPTHIRLRPREVFHGR